MDHGVQVSDILADAFSGQFSTATCTDDLSKEKAIQLGLSLGM